MHKSFNFYFLLKQISFQSCYLIHILSFNTSKARILNVALCGQENYNGCRMKPPISSFYEGCIWTLPHDTNILPNVERKKVSPFLSGPFSKACHFFWNWKFQLVKDTNFLVAFYILAADRLKEEVSAGHREHPDRFPSALRFAAYASLSWLLSILKHAVLCNSLLCVFIYFYCLFMFVLQW